MKKLIPREELEKVVKLYMLGISYTEIGKIYGVGRMIVYGIVKTSKVDTSSRIIQRVQNKEFIKKCIKDLNVKFNKEDSFFAKYGMSMQAFKEITNENYVPYKRYSTQKSTARLRGIEFKLTFAEWLKIWTDSGQMNNSGKYKGNYVMARTLDKGAYEVGNVKIVTGTANHKEVPLNKALKTIMAHTGKSLEEIKEAIYG